MKVTMKVIKKIDLKNDLYYHVFKWLNNDIFHWDLPDGDIKVLSELYKANFEMLETVKDSNDRMALLFSTRLQKKIIADLDIAYNTFHNSLTRLRKKSLIDQNSLDEATPLMFNLNADEFNFTIALRNEETKS